MPSDLITTRQAAVVLDCSDVTVLRMADAGALDYAQKLPGPNGAYLYERATVLRVAAERAAKKAERTGSKA